MNKKSTKNLQIKSLILSGIVFTAIALSVLIISHNINRKSEISRSSLINIDKNSDLSWTTSNLVSSNNNHYIAYVKSNDQDIWLQNVNTGEEILAFPKIDYAYFCNEGCTTRSFRFSPDGKKLIADLLVQDGNAGFGYINIESILQNNEIHFVRTGYDPFFSYDNKKVVFSDKSYYPATLSYQDLTRNKVVSIGNFRVSDWSSQSELLLYNTEETDQTGTFYRYDMIDNTLTKIIVNNLAEKRKYLLPLSTSPLKDKILVKSYEGHPKLGVTSLDGIDYIQVESDNSPIGTWSPDGKMIAVQNLSIYPTQVSDSIKIISLENFTTIKTINVDISYTPSLCWLPNTEGDILVYSNKNNEIVLLNLKTNLTKTIPRAKELYYDSGIACF